MSQRDSGYARAELDLYETPEWVTAALVSNVQLAPFVWEPACGRGKMVRVLETMGHQVYATDMVDRGFAGQQRALDFLLVDEVPADFRHDGDIDIATNPPFGQRGTLAEAFLRHALRLTEARGGRVAMLFQSDFDHAKGRRDLFRDHPAYSAKVVLTERIRWFEGSSGSPSQNHAWFVWDWRNEHLPSIHYAGSEVWA